MPGYDVCIPMHITALYVFTVVNVLLLVNLALVDANVFVTGRENQTRRVFYDLPASFGPSFPEGGLVGYTVASDPINGCDTIAAPPYELERPFVWIAVIQRNDCAFDRKVLNAQKAGYGAAIVYNVNSSILIPMGGDPFNQVVIPSCFVGSRDGQLLSFTFNYTSRFFVTIDNDVPFDGTYYLFPLAIVLGICFILMVIFMVGKWLRDLHKRRKSRLSKSQLNKVPTKNFQKSDNYDVCAVCLDDYEEGQKLRVLPCSHAYHIECIDPWLLKNKPTCPICKRKVIASLPDAGDSDQHDSDSDADEDTPLIRQVNAGRPTSFGSINPVMRPPNSIYHHDMNDDDDSDDSDSSDYDEVATGEHGRLSVNTTPRDQKEVVAEINETNRNLPTEKTQDTDAVATKSSEMPPPDMKPDIPPPAGVSSGADVAAAGPIAPLEPEVIVHCAGRQTADTENNLDGVV